MSKNFKEITQDISPYLAKFRKALPEVSQGFSALSQAATREGALDKKTKELIALSLGVAGHCDACIGFHSQALVRLGASLEEVMEALGMAVYMGGGPSLMYAAEAIKAFEEFAGSSENS
jgi:AhpD family alkylhydroperoxidase